jgi:transcriptional regulator with XRE-family HTH domain
MDDLTQKDYALTFREIYNQLPERQAVKAPKTEFVERMAKVTMKSTKTIRCWLAGTQSPDALSKSVLEKELGVPADQLFPKQQEAHV